MKMRVASGGIWTHDTLYSGQMLYQLSYQGSSAGRVRIKHLIRLYEHVHVILVNGYLTHVNTVKGETLIHSWSYPTTIGCIGKGIQSSPAGANEKRTIIDYIMNLLWSTLYMYMYNVCSMYEYTCSNSWIMLGLEWILNYLDNYPWWVCFFVSRYLVCTCAETKHMKS